MVRKLSAVALLATLSALPCDLVWATSGTMTVTTDTVLTEDHTGNIIIGADNIVLDCDGHRVTGPGAAGPGIRVDGRGGTTVQNCIVERFPDGFQIMGARANVFRQNLVKNNTLNGFRIRESVGNIFLQNTVTRNRLEGFDIDRSDANLLSDNDISLNDISGVELDDCNGNVLERNNVNDNGRHGFSLDRSGGNFFARNIANSNGRTDPTGQGFRIENMSNDNRIIANIACQNHSFDAFQDDSVRNWFIENGFCSSRNIVYLP